MSLTLLLNLDDTLLDINLNTFRPAYFQALSQQMGGHLTPSVMLRSLIKRTNLMNERADPAHNLQQVFDGDFYPSIGIAKDALADVIEEFYDNIFPSLAENTRQLPDAVLLIEWALSRGYRVAIATDPLFPRKATYQRLRWAGFNPELFAVVSTVERFHFSRSHPAYYAELLGQLGWPDGPILMVGHDSERDLIPAHLLGLKTYLIDGESARGPGFEAGRGKLSDLRPWLHSIDFSILEPSFRSRQSNLAIMASIPAVLQSLSAHLTEQDWHQRPTPDDWSMNEIVCHLRDTEREVHQMQLRLMLNGTDAFIPRPDTAVWASERDYLHVKGESALAEFAAARVESLGILEQQDKAMWSRKARHAIFGPTNFLEVVSFFADHDRLHIQQAWKILKSI